MDIQNILNDLKKQRENIDRAIAALEGIGTGQRRRGRPAGSRNVATSAAAGRPRRHMSPAARKRISEMMKQRWAERKRRAKS
jgi:hypothetical protein